MLLIDSASAQGAVKSFYELFIWGPKIKRGCLKLQEALCEETFRKVNWPWISRDFVSTLV